MKLLFAFVDKINKCDIIRLVIKNLKGSRSHYSGMRYVITVLMHSGSF